MYTAARLVSAPADGQDHVVLGVTHNEAAPRPKPIRRWTSSSRGVDAAAKQHVHRIGLGLVERRGARTYVVDGG
jgi:hypothetical protein